MKKMHLCELKALSNFITCNTSSSQWVLAGKKKELQSLRNIFPQIATTTLYIYNVVLPHFRFNLRGRDYKHKL